MRRGPDARVPATPVSEGVKEQSRKDDWGITNNKKDKQILSIYNLIRVCCYFGGRRNQNRKEVKNKSKRKSSTFRPIWDYSEHFSRNMTYISDGITHDF